MLLFFRNNQKVTILAHKSILLRLPRESSWNSAHRKWVVRPRMMPKWYEQLWNEWKHTLWNCENMVHWKWAGYRAHEASCARYPAHFQWTIFSQFHKVCFHSFHNCSYHFGIILGRTTHFLWAEFHEDSRGSLKSIDLWARMVTFWLFLKNNNTVFQK